jgi:ppGpp synthetase/RelA/SpoT-type nucleotidyltranferase
MQIDYLKDRCVFEGNKVDVVPAEMAEFMSAFLPVENIYTSAINDIFRRIESINDELKATKGHNPIYKLVTRVKTPKSIA